MAAFYNIQIPLTGRQFEYNRMRKILETNQSELLALIGRRRVGKTFLIKKTYENEMVFHITGIQNVNRKIQLENFTAARNFFFRKALIMPGLGHGLKHFPNSKNFWENRARKNVSFFLMNCHGWPQEAKSF